MREMASMLIKLTIQIVVIIRQVIIIVIAIIIIIIIYADCT